MPENAYFVIDGGFLLHFISWPVPATYRDIIHSFANYISCRFGKNCIIVFDGYNVVLSTKAVEQERRCLKVTSANILFSVESQCMVPQAQFLGNPQNKSRLITILSEALLLQGFLAKQAKGDADELTVSIALEASRFGHEIVIVGKDTDLLVILLARAIKEDRLYLLNQNLKAKKIYNIRNMQEVLGDDVKIILPFHALTGCDTTSAFYGRGKKFASSGIIR